MERRTESLPSEIATEKKAIPAEPIGSESMIGTVFHCRGRFDDSLSQIFNNVLRLRSSTAAS
eukprot:8970275-Prorocentrum_lima.AAC.1